MSWNKKHNLVSTLSSDRACRTYNSATKKVVSKSYKANLNLNEESSKKKKVTLNADAEGAGAGAMESETKTSDNKGDESSKKSKKAAGQKSQSKEKEVRLFHDETFKGFFRRLSWSNDGKLNF